MLHSRPHRILVAEDNELNQRVIRELLRHRGYEVDVVDGGYEAIAALEKGSYHLLILDCMMPGLDGFDTSRMIRSGEHPNLDRTIPILATTALSSKSDRQRCLDAGMDDYLSKPIKAKVLFERIEHLIARHWTPKQTEDISGVPAGDRKLDGTLLVETIVDSIAGKLVNEVRDWETQLGALFEGRDWTAIANLAHKIRGAVELIGHPGLSKLTIELEQSAVAKNEQATAKALTEVNSGLQSVRRELGQRS